MLKNILFSVAAILAVFVVVVAVQPPTFRVTRSAAIAAAPAVVFAQVNDLRNWEAWSPWAKLDPAMKKTFDGPPAGAGAIHAWAGNREVGEGRMTITDSRPNELVRFQLEFLQPFAATHTAEFSFRTEGGLTLVSWSMFGSNNFIAKAIGLFMDCDKMIGDQFEQGLARMKAIAEAAPRY